MDGEEAAALMPFNPDRLIDRYYTQCSPPPPPSSLPQPTKEACDSSIPNSKFQTFFLKTLVVAFFTPFLLFLGTFVGVRVVIKKASKVINSRRHHQITTTRPLSDSLLENDLYCFRVGTGLSPRDLQKFPCFNYGDVVESGDCTICLESFREGESCRSLPKCKHVFHADCVDSWLIRVPACPSCRGVVEPELNLG